MANSDDLPGVTKGGVAAGPPMPTPTAPTVGTSDPMLVHPHLDVEGAFAIGDNSGS